MDHWLDICCFTAAFPNLFPKGIRSNLDERAIPVLPSCVGKRDFSTIAEGERTLQYLRFVSANNCRFAYHETFEYLVFDTLRSLLGDMSLDQRRYFLAPMTSSP